MKNYTTAVKKTVNHSKAIKKAEKLGLRISPFNNVNLYVLELMCSKNPKFQLYINDGIITGNTKVIG